MIGQLDIWRYRNETQNFLGKDFSLKEFHFQALSQGASPLSYLENHLKKYRACKKKPKNEGCNIILNPGTGTTTTTTTNLLKAKEEELDLIWPKKTHFI